MLFRSLNGPVLTTGSFIFDPTVATKTVLDHESHYTFEPSGYSRHWSNFVGFPRQINSDVWIFDSNTMQVKSNRTNPGPIELSFRSSGYGFEITQIIDSVCPEIDSVNVTGCYNCVNAPIVKIRARSSCRAGIANPTFNDSAITTLTTAIHLTEVFQDFEVKIIIGVANVNSGVCLISDSRGDCSVVAGKLSAAVIDLGNTGGTMNGTNMTNITPTGNGVVDFFNGVGDSISKVFTGIGDVFDWLKTVATLLISAVLLVLIIYAISMVVQVWRGKMIKKKKNV